MTVPGYLAALSREAIPIQAALSYYGLQFSKSGFAKCPFHGPERTASLRAKGQRYTCFSCNASGDIIDFVQQYYGLTFYKALQKLNNDFALQLPLTSSLSKGDQARAAAYARERAEKKAMEAQALAEYANADMWLCHWEYVYWLYRPITPKDFSLQYQNACWALPIARDRHCRALDNLQQMKRR